MTKIEKHLKHSFFYGFMLFEVLDKENKEFYTRNRGKVTLRMFLDRDVVTITVDANVFSQGWPNRSFLGP